MDNEELNDLTEDGDVLRTYRARARRELDEIARQAKQALAEHKIDLDVFFLVPNSGEAIVTYGTHNNPDDATWERVGDIVSDVLRQVVGMEGTRHASVMCSTTTDVVAHTEQPSLHIPAPKRSLS